ncbi:MAG: hypothetical protein EBX39_03780 [Actinobacteria bacterium]|nr:hypothetical protein [Actinomycetota bacterium]
MDADTRRRVILSIAAVVLVAVVGTTAFLELTGRTQAREVPTSSAAPSSRSAGADYSRYRTEGWVATENQRPGTRDWQIPDDRAMWSKISGYAEATSIDLGETTSIHVTTNAPSWVVSAYRIGYYGGAGGRLVWRSDPQPGVVQPRPTFDVATRTASANWPSSLDIEPDPTWPPGQYLLRLESSDGGATFIPLVIRDDAGHSDILMQSAVTTWQAYNGWGGASIYIGETGRADVVSFDRPYTGNGSGEFLGREYEFIFFVERLGLDVSYWTNIDLDERGELATNHRAIVIPGHDEYYTVRMRENLERARDAGVNIGFFGANNVYRRIRLESVNGRSSRRLVNYRDARRDPMAATDPRQVTTSFREAPAANPESSLTGSYYECNPVSADWVVADASAWMFEGSGIRNGDHMPKMVGNEYDRVTSGVPTPTNIQVIARSPVTCRGMNSYADSTWYSTPSGAGVFSAGTFGWSPLLDDISCGDAITTNSTMRCRILRVTENILRAFAAGPAGAAHPSVSNTALVGSPKPPTAAPSDDSPSASSSTTTTKPPGSTSSSSSSTSSSSTTSTSGTSTSTSTPSG